MCLANGSSILNELKPDEWSRGLPQCRHWWTGGKGLDKAESRFWPRSVVATNLSRACSHKLLSVIQQSGIPCIQIFLSSWRKLRAWRGFCNSVYVCDYWYLFCRGDTSSKRPLYDFPSSDESILDPKRFRRKGQYCVSLIPRVALFSSRRVLPLLLSGLSVDIGV